MYGLALCGVCRRPRIVDESKSESACPYCNCVQKTKDLAVYFESSDQDAVREALSQATGFIPPDMAKKKEMSVRGIVTVRPGMSIFRNESVMIWKSRSLIPASICILLPKAPP